MAYCQTQPPKNAAYKIMKALIWGVLALYFGVVLASPVILVMVIVKAFYFTQVP